MAKVLRPLNPTSFTPPMMEKFDLQPNFDFVAFDWKGTLEAKMSTKSHREEAALSACAGELIKASMAKHGAVPEAEIRPHVEYELQILLQSYLMEKKKAKKLKKQTNSACTHREIFERALDDSEIRDADLRQRLIEVFLNQYATSSPKNCHCERNNNALVKEDCSCPTVVQAKGGLFDGGHELLQRLMENKIPIALIRNSSLMREQFEQTLIRTGVQKYFSIEHNVILGGEVGFAKPDRRIFETALRKMGMEDIHNLRPERILFVGNETAADILGAKRMGWKAVLIRTTEQSSNGLADYEIDSLPELHKIIFEKN